MVRLRAWQKPTLQYGKQPGYRNWRSAVRGCAKEKFFGSHQAEHGTEVANGAMGLDVRNADGLIVVSDFTTGFWAFRMEGFEGWNGNDWGMPNISSVQDWDNGPEGARRATVF